MCLLSIKPNRILPCIDKSFYLYFFLFFLHFSFNIFLTFLTPCTILCLHPFVAIPLKFIHFPITYWVNIENGKTIRFYTGSEGTWYKVRKCGQVPCKYYYFIQASWFRGLSQIDRSVGLKLLPAYQCRTLCLLFPVGIIC